MPPRRRTRWSPVRSNQPRLRLLGGRSGFELFGLERLKALLQRLRDEPLAILIARVLAELDDFGAGVSERDDETLVAVRRR